jgi:Tol biopolymer transport system component
MGAVVAFLAVLVVSPAGSTPPGRDGLIAYVSHGSWVSRTYGIVLVKADGTGRRDLTRNYRDSSPAWSPDGSKVVFVRAGRLYVSGSDGSGLRRITPLRLNRVFDPTWSPDGRSIAFVRGRTIYVMRSNGAAIHPIFQRARVLVNRPSWSPDGKWIAFGLWPEDSYDGTIDGFTGSIAIVQSTGGGFRYVTEGRTMDASSDPGTDANDYEPDWSPDGTRLAFTRIVWSCGSKCDHEELYSVAADGSDPRWISTDTSYTAHRPSWSPRGDRIVAETSRGVAIITAAGKLMRVLDPLGTEPVWQPLK